MNIEVFDLWLIPNSKYEDSIIKRMFWRPVVDDGKFMYVAVFLQVFVFLRRCTLPEPAFLVRG
jgi:hypothetical protein